MTSRYRSSNELHSRILATLVYNGGEITHPGGQAISRLASFLAVRYDRQKVASAVAVLEKQSYLIRDNRPMGGNTTPRTMGQARTPITPKLCYGIYLAKERDELGEDLQFYLDELDTVVKQRMIDAARRQYKAGEEKHESRRQRTGGGAKTASSPATEKKTETKVVMIQERAPEPPEHVEFRTVKPEPDVSADTLFADTSAAALIADALLEKLVEKIREPATPQVVEVPVPTEVSNAVIDGLKHEMDNLRAMLKRRDENMNVLQARVEVLGKENEQLRRALLSVRDRGGRLTQSIEQILDPDIKRQLGQMVTERPDQQHRRGPRPPEGDRK